MGRFSNEVRWFETLGTCPCGKPATGTLRGPRNDSYGRTCTKCGDKAVKDATAAREKGARS